MITSRKTYMIASIGDHGEVMVISKARGGKTLYASDTEAKAAIEAWVAVAYAPYYPKWRFSWEEVVEDSVSLDEGYRWYYILTDSETGDSYPFATVIELNAAC